MFEASLIGVISGKWGGIRKRIYTRHHSDFHHTYFPRAVKWDLLINHFSTHIIAVSKNVAEILVEREKVQKNKVYTIPHGIPKDVMDIEILQEDVELMKRKNNLNDFSPIIGVVSRFTQWKGVQFIIPAFKELLHDYPNAKLVLANAKGDYKNEIEKLLSQLPGASFTLIEFESNMPVLFKTFDVFVHTPIDKYCEAFGQVYIEAMCYGVPMICTLSGIGNDLVVQEQNALTVAYKNSSEILMAMKRIVSNSELKKKLINNGKVDVKQFTFEEKYSKVKSIYLS